MKDPALGMCSPSARGIYIDLLCAMYESDTPGTLTGTTEMLARLCRCSESEMQAAVNELGVTKTLRVTHCHKNITLESRRLIRESKGKENNKIRQQKYRRNARCNEKVTPSSSSSTSVTLIVPSVLFEQFWAVYPKKRSKGQARKAWAKLNPDEQLLTRILDAVERAKTSGDWAKDGGKFIPYPATWLNAEGWLDEVQPAAPEPSFRDVN